MALQNKAKELGVVIIGSLFEMRAPGLYHNTAVIIDATGELLGIYRKMHIPDDPHFYEKFYFTPGDLGFQSLEDKIWENWCADLLGPMVSGGRASDRAARGADPVLSDGHRVASIGKSGIRHGST